MGGRRFLSTGLHPSAKWMRPDNKFRSSIGIIYKRKRLHTRAVRGIRRNPELRRELTTN